MPSPATRQTLSMTQVLVCGAAIVTLSMGIRHGFGLWLQPITMDRGWTRETFAFALAIQNLAWGLAGPIAGGLADRLGAFRVLLVAAALYAGGLVTMALATSGLAFTGSAGVMLGLAQSGCTYAVVYGVIGRNVEPDATLVGDGRDGRRRLVRPVPDGAGGELADLAASAGRTRWSLLGCLALAIMPLAFGLKEPPRAPAAGVQQGIGAALREAFGYRSFQLLTAGYFVCGFQVVFIGVHMPSYLKDKGLGPDVATTALALIGLFNVFGTYAAGEIGAALAEALAAVGDLLPARGGHRRLPVVAADAVERLHLRLRDGPAVAVDRAADECHCRADLRRAVHVDAQRLRVPEPPARLVHGRVAGR